MRIPSEDPAAWNTLTLDGKRVPGKVKFPRFTVERKVDSKESAGSETFSLTDQGATCTTVDVEFELWLPEHFDDFTPLYAAYIDPRRPLKKRSIVSVSHPSLYAAGIKLLYFNAADGLQPTSGEHGRIYVVKAKGLEFNAKTRLASTGNSKPKPAPSYAGQGGKWTTGALGSAPTYGPPADAATKPAPPAPQTIAQQQQKAAKGDARAQFVSKVAAGWAPVVIGG